MDNELTYRERLEKESVELNLRPIYDSLLVSCAKIIHYTQFVERQNKPERWLTAEDINQREMGYLERIKTDYMFKKQVEVYAHMQLDFIRKALNPPSIKETEMMEMEALKLLKQYRDGCFNSLSPLSPPIEEEE